MQLLFVLHNLSLLIVLLGISMLLPLLTALIYGEAATVTFLISFLVCMAAGLLLYFPTRGKKKEISHKDGFAIVALGWISIAFFGALPYVLSGALPSFTDAYFESASGFTTTGATVIGDVEALDHAMLFWRSFTQWLGGMGIILLSIAILPLLGVGGMQLYKAEVPGPVTDKLKPRIGETAKILWKVYLLFTFIEFILLRAGGMSFFDAICHSFTTMATGGFSTKNLGISAFESAYIEGVVIFFMFVAGTNFALHYQFLRGNFRALLKDEEFRFYTCVVLASTLLLFASLLITEDGGPFHALRLSLFQTLTILTSTGYASADFEKWSSFGQYFLFTLMFVGGCAGSTSGGIKSLRIYLLLKQGYRELYRLIHPRAVVHVKLNGMKVSSEVMNSVWGFVFLYMLTFILSSVTLCSLGLDMVSSMTAVATCMGNIGPGLGSVGPFDNFAHIHATGKWVLSLCMILGRLEIYTLIILLMPEYWKK